DRRWWVLTPALTVLVLLLSWTAHDQPVYSNLMSAYSGAMKKLIAQEKFGEAARYKEKLFEENRLETAGLYLPRRNERLDRIEDAFRAFDLGSLYGPEEAGRYLNFAQGYYLLLESTKRLEFDEFAEYTRAAAEKALALDPNIIGAHKVLGLCLTEQAIRGSDTMENFLLWARALWYLKEELKLNHDDLDCIQGLGSLHLVFGNIKEAVDCYRKYLRKSPQWDPKTAYQLGRILTNQPELKGQFLDLAMKIAVDLYRYDDRNIRYGRLYAYVLELSGRNDESAEILKKLVPLDPESAGEYICRIEKLRNPEDNDESSIESNSESDSPSPE
ncbi:MAG: hypothetical protein KJ645_00670, partial [Planctomycetes bacterium]|nr:hypothetical protein [Planctomycetota bacterium]